MRRRALGLAAAATVLAATVGTGSAAQAAPALPTWQERPTGTTEQFRGLAAVNRYVGWVAGTNGTVLRTFDGGRHWEDVSPPGAEDLEFRDIEAFGARHAVALSIGEGEASRVYVTRDGGRHWRESFVNDDPAAFYDCMTFFDERHGLAMSDPVDGRIRLIRTSDGGRSWRVADPAGMPEALPGEFGFAASGTCLVSSGPWDAWIATGGGERSRVFRTGDRGRTWSVVDTPVPSGPSAGIYALAFRDRRHGLAVGGDYTTPESAPDAFATTRDGGRSFRLVGAGAPTEYRSGAAWLGARVAFAVGPTGSDVSVDGGHTWRTFDEGSLDGVQCTADRSCWGSGPDGRVTILRGYR